MLGNLLVVIFLHCFEFCEDRIKSLPDELLASMDNVERDTVESILEAHPVLEIGMADDAFLCHGDY
jgi:hypothetical protein